ncbi:MAG: TonB-dependent receptor plug domain-containing protein, partial [Pseudomonadota bacterium]
MKPCRSILALPTSGSGMTGFFSAANKVHKNFMRARWRRTFAGSSTGHGQKSLVVVGRSLKLSCLLLVISALHAQAVFAEQAGSGKSNFNIPQQRADRALTAFAEQADLTLMFPYELARNERANETVGRYTVAEAITRLLAGTRLDPVFDRAGRLKIVPRSNEVEEKAMTADRRTGFAALLSGIFIAPMGYAQEVAVDGAKIEEIVVTAQIREESFQEIPVTGSVFDAQTLDDNRLELLDDVARFTPGLVVSYFNNSSPNFAIRGAMNTFSQAGASKPVGIFVDDVFIPRNSAAAFELFDIHQVSVLRGPQGTLFGRN